MRGAQGVDIWGMGALAPAFLHKTVFFTLSPFSRRICHKIPFSFIFSYSKSFASDAIDHTDKEISEINPRSS